jgi:hypothetical protein
MFQRQIGLNWAQLRAGLDDGMLIADEVDSQLKQIIESFLNCSGKSSLILNRFVK